MEHQTNRNKGYSLIELLIAVAILSVIMIMVTQFMGTSSGALKKTKKNLSLQTEAIEVGEQMSDVLMQATYIRVRPQDNTLYKLNNTVGTTSAGKKKRNREVTTETAITGDLVVDNYPNYFKSSTDPDRDIILDLRTGQDLYTLVDKDKHIYPLDTDSDSAWVHSFRILTSGTERSYVIPQYIYVQYQKKIGGSESTAYIIYYFKENQIYMARGNVDATVADDGFANAVAQVTGRGGQEGLLTDSIMVQEGTTKTDCYFSADSDSNTVFLDINYVDKKYKQYTYNYAEAIEMLNTNVLTVPPQKLYELKN